MMRAVYPCLVLAGALALGCAALEAEIERSEQRAREAQTRVYETSDVKTVMKGILTALQDEGFVVKNANLELGLVAATKETDVGDDGSWAWLSGKTRQNEKDQPRQKTEVLDCTANVSGSGNQSRVRVTFQRKVLDARGQVLTVAPVEDRSFYREFFAKVDKGMALQEGKM
jgi:hypothetical protein